MPRNSSGVYSKPAGTTAVTDTTIEASSYNTLMDDISSAITGSLPRDGSAGMNANVPMGGFVLAALGAGASAGQSIRYEQCVGVLNAPSTTSMLFKQTSAPTGWTKGTDQNDKALRIVSGTPSTGGSTAFSSVFAARTIALANLPSASLSHSLSVVTTLTNGSQVIHGTSGTEVAGGGNPGRAVADLASSTVSLASGAVSGTVSLGGSGTAMDFAVQYVDVIYATKD